MKAHADEILHIINKCNDVLEKEYVKPIKPTKKDIYNFFDKSEEIRRIYNIEVDENYRVLKLENKYKNELSGFLY